MFGVDDDLLMMALEWRIKVGTPELQKASQTRATVSLCMIVKDEENNLPRCLLDAARIVDEIIVVDTGSSDRTEEIAAAFGAKVFSTKWTGDFSCARNASIAEASGDWIFVLDADELVSPSDHDEFRKLTADTRKKNLAYSFTTRNYVRQPDVQDWRKNDGRYQEEAGTGWIPSSKVRLFRRNPDVQFAQPVHESVEQSLRKSGIDIVHCRIQIHHYGKLDPRRTREKARVYRELGEAKLNNEPDDAKALYELAVQEHENGNYERALELWMKLASRFPDSAKAQMGLGSACVALGKHADAEAPLRAAVKLDPSFKEAHVKYALTLIHLGRESEAVQLMEQLSHAHAEYPHARAALAAALLCLGEKSRGLAIIKKMKDDGIAADDFFSDVARDLRAGGRRDLAVRLLEALAEDEIISAKLGSQLVAYYKEQAMQNHSLVGG
jgi:Flp pilus assembly protein TadD